MDALDVGTLVGRIELDDAMSSGFTVLLGHIDQFTEKFDGLTGTVLVGAAAAVAAIGGITAAVVTLGNRGSDVNDVASTLDHFAGSAENAQTILNNMRAGVKGTVDDFELMKESSRLLSARVKLSADDFSTLGQAAFVLQNRGLGPTKDMLDLVSNALVTGRTRQLAYSLGIVDAANGEEMYAKQLGLRVDQLTEVQKKEATRLEVMKMLNDAVRDAGQQELDFGEKLEAAGVFMKNWIDELASAVAKSPHVMAAVDAIGNALKQAFGGDAKTAQEAVLHGIEKFADGVAYYGPIIIQEVKNILTALKDVVTFVVNTWNAMPDWAKSAAKDIALLTAAGWALNKMWSATTVVATAFGGTVTGVASKATGLLGTLMGVDTALTGVAAVLNPVTLLLGSVGVGFLIAKSNMDEFIKNSYNLQNAYKNIAEFEKKMKAGTQQTADDFKEYNKALQTTGKIRTNSVMNKFDITDNGGFAVTVDVNADKVKQQIDSIKSALGDLNVEEERRKALQAEEAQRLAAKAKQLDEVNRKIREATGQTGYLTQAQEELVRSYQYLGLSNDEIALKLGISVQKLNLWTKAQKESTDATNAAIESNDEILKSWHKYNEEVAKARADAFIGLIQDERSYTEQSQALRMTDLEKQIAEITRARDAKLAAYAATSVQFGLDVSKAAALLNKFTNEEIEQLKAVDAMQRQLSTSLAKWANGFGFVKSVVSDLGSVGGRTWQTINRFIGQGIDLLGQYRAQQIINAATSKAVQAGEIAGQKAVDAALQATTVAANLMWAALTLGASAAISWIVSLFQHQAQLRQAIKDTTAALKEFGFTQDELDAREGRHRGSQGRLDDLNKLLDQAKAASDSISKMIGQISDSLDQFGGKAPAELQPYIADLLTMKGLTADQIAQLQKLQGPTPWQKLEEAAGRYDLALDKLGKGYQQLKLNDTFDQLFSDWKMFQDANADVGAAMEAMKAKVSQAVIQAKKFGTDVPEYMRPMLTAFLNAGELIDENGNKLTDLGDIHFSASIESSMEKIADILTEIKNALLGLGPAAKLGADGVSDAMDRIRRKQDEVRDDVVYKATPRLTGQDLSVESTVRQDVSRKQNTTVIWEVDGRRIASVVVPYIPDEVQRYRVGA